MGLRSASAQLDTVATHAKSVEWDTIGKQYNIYTREVWRTSLDPLHMKSTFCYRDPSDRSQGPLGKCKQCDCNGNEQSCDLDIYSGQQVCTCKPGYSGQRCEVAG